jgi:hypothetical protein
MNRVRIAVFFCLVVSCSLIAGARDGLPLRVSLPPVYASLPIAFAEEWGLFEEYGVDVEIIGMTDNQVRSAALATGDLDFVVEDVTQFILDLQSGQQLLATSAAYVRPQTGSMLIGLVSPASFRFETIDDFLETDYIVGTMYRSDHEYMLDLLFDEILEDEDDRPMYSYMTDVLFLATWFGAQALPAAVLPEPYVSYIDHYKPPSGSRVEVNTLSDFSEFEPLPSLFVFRADYAKEHPEIVEAFYDAYVAAIERINATPRDEIIDTGLDVVLPLFFQGADPATIGQEILDAIAIPTFELPKELPTEQFSSVLEWMHEKGYAFLRPAYADVVCSTYLP